MSIVRWVWVLVIAMGVLPEMASAQSSAADEEARNLFQAGRIAYERGRFDKALEHFTEAYELSGRPQLLFNIANAYDRLRQDADALAAFEKFARDVPDSPRIEIANERIAFLRERTAKGSPVASPEEAAKAYAQHDPVSGDSATRDDRDKVSLTKKWWFWTLVGAVAVGAATGIAVAASGGGSTRTADPVAFDGNTMQVGL